MHKRKGEKHKPAKILQALKKLLEAMMMQIIIIALQPRSASREMNTWLFNQWFLKDSHVVPACLLAPSTDKTHQGYLNVTY